jgi:hypothetical protein
MNGGEEGLAMKEYNVYVPCPEANGSEKGTRSRLWLENLLREKFGYFQSATAIHEGITAGFAFQGKVQAYSLCAEEAKARPFFKNLKQQIKKQGRPDVLILEKEAPGPKGELAGERI